MSGLCVLQETWQHSLLCFRNPTSVLFRLETIQNKSQQFDVFPHAVQLCVFEKATPSFRAGSQLHDELCGQGLFQQVYVQLCKQFHRKPKNLQPIQ